MSKIYPYIFQGTRALAALIMLQTLYFKFSASPESVYIFTTIGMEPWGRIGIGIGELIASILLFVPYFSWFGALMGIGLMSGALFFHFTKLGFVVMDDGGYLFFLACIVIFCSAFVLYFKKEQMISFLSQIIDKK